MLQQLTAPRTLLEVALLVVATIVLLLALSRVESAESGYMAGRALVWLMVLTSVVPVTIDELTGGRSADVTGGVDDSQLGPLAQSLSHVMQVLLVLVAALALREAVLKRVRGASSAFWLILALWFVTLLSAIANSWSPKLLGWLLPLVVLALFASARSGAPILSELRRVLVAVLAASLAMFVLAPGAATMTATRSAEGGGARLAGVFSHPNGMGAAAAAALVLGLATSSGLRRVAISLMALLTLALADSRTALVAAAVCIPLVLAAPAAVGARVDSDAVRRLILAVCSLAGGTLVVQGLLANSTDISSVNGRTLVWQYVIEEWQRQPALGAGPDGWSAARLLAEVPQYAGQAHNQFFETLYLYGLAGVVVLGLVVVVALVKAGRLWRTGAPAALALLVCILVTGFSESPLKFDISGLTAEGAIALVAIAVIQAARPAPVRTARVGGMADRGWAQETNRVLTH